MPSFFRYQRSVSVEQFAATYTPDDPDWEKLGAIALDLGLEPEGADEIRIVFVKRREREENVDTLRGIEAES